MNPQSVFRKLDLHAAYLDLVPTLKWKGESAKGKCPLCNSKTFTVDREGRFGCSKCEDAGNVFHLYATMNKKNFEEAVEFYDSYTKVHKSATAQVEKLELVEFNAVIEERVTWLWHDYIPANKITFIEGNSELGKSLICTDIAARVTTGRKMPDGSKGMSGGVVVIASEDGLQDTIVPRFRVAGGDKNRAVFIKGLRNAQGVPRLVTVKDVTHIEDACKRKKAKLIVIDPLFGHMPEKIDIYKDSDVRRALTSLVEMADRLKVAVLGIRHLNKSSLETQALFRGMGSIAFTALSRSALLVGKDRLDDNRKVLTSIKSNLGPKPASLFYRIEAVHDTKDHRHHDGIPRIAWEGVANLTADDLLTAPKPKKETALDLAKEWLKDQLKDGPKNAKEFEEIGELGYGFSQRVLDTAKKELNVESRKTKMGWVWDFKDAK